MNRFLVVCAVLVTSSALMGMAQAQSSGPGMGMGYGSGMGQGPCPGYGQGMGQGYGSGMGPGYNQGYGHGMAPGYGMRPGYNRGYGQSMAPGGGRQFMVRFAAIDANEDGRVSSEEAAQNVESVFLAMDADDDDALTLAEYMAVRMGPGQQMNPNRQQTMQGHKKSRFGKMDTNADGSVSRQEFLKSGEARFKASDMDKDGKVNPWEFRMLRHR